MKAGEKRPGMVVAMQQKNSAQMAPQYNGKDHGNDDHRITNAYKKHGGN